MNGCFWSVTIALVAFSAIVNAAPTCKPKIRNVICHPKLKSFGVLKKSLGLKDLQKETIDFSTMDCEPMPKDIDMNEMDKTLVLSFMELPQTKACNKPRANQEADRLSISNSPCYLFSKDTDHIACLRKFDEPENFLEPEDNPCIPLKEQKGDFKICNNMWFAKTMEMAEILKAVHPCSMIQGKKAKQDCHEKFELATSEMLVEENPCLPLKKSKKGFRPCNKMWNKKIDTFAIRSEIRDNSKHPCNKLKYNLERDSCIKSFGKPLQEVDFDLDKPCRFFLNEPRGVQFCIKMWKRKLNQEEITLEDFTTAAPDHNTNSYMTTHPMFYTTYMYGTTGDNTIPTGPVTTYMPGTNGPNTMPAGPDTTYLPGTTLPNTMPTGPDTTFITSNTEPDTMPPGPVTTYMPGTTGPNTMPAGPVSTNTPGNTEPNTMPAGPVSTNTPGNTEPNTMPTETNTGNPTDPVQTTRYITTMAEGTTPA